MTIDLNTIIGTAILALSGWTLYTLHEMSKTAAARDEHDKAQDQQLAENRARIIAAEQNISSLQVDVGRLQER